MPEGPSIVILKEEVQPFLRKKVLAASGNSTKIDIAALTGKVVKDFKSWGKHFLICFSDRTIRIHFLLFGSYKVNSEKDASPRLTLHFSNGFIHFYACSVLDLRDDLDTIYDWTVDVMSPSWSAQKARKKLKSHPDMLVCDAILNQDIFSGAGNIIKNEVLYRIGLHPLSRIGSLPPAMLNRLVKEVVNYSFDFLEWKKEYTLRKHWLAHTKKTCRRCELPLTKAYLGRTNRRTFFCANCQALYDQ